MKIEIGDRRKLVVAVGLSLVATVLVGRWFVAGSGVSAGEVRNPPRTSLASVAAVREAFVDPRLRLELLREAEGTTYLGGGRNIFRVVEEPSSIEAVRKVEPKVPESPKLVEVPPIPLSFFGFSRKGGVSTVFLLKGEDVFLAREGDIVDRRYKIVRVRPDAVDIEDLLSERSERLRIRRG